MRDVVLALATWSRRLRRPSHPRSSPAWNKRRHPHPCRPRPSVVYQQQKARSGRTVEFFGVFLRRRLISARGGRAARWRPTQTAQRNGPSVPRLSLLPHLSPPLALFLSDGIISRSLLAKLSLCASERASNSRSGEESRCDGPPERI